MIWLNKMKQNTCAIFVWLGKTLNHYSLFCDGSNGKTRSKRLHKQKNCQVKASSPSLSSLTLLISTQLLLNSCHNCRMSIQVQCKVNKHKKPRPGCPGAEIINCQAVTQNKKTLICSFYFFLTLFIAIYKAIFIIDSIVVSYHQIIINYLPF